MKKCFPALFLAAAVIRLACPRATAATAHCGEAVTVSIACLTQQASYATADDGNEVVTPTYATSSSPRADAELCDSPVSDLLTLAVCDQVAFDSAYFPGMAILNPNEANAIATVDVYDRNGNLVSQKRYAPMARPFCGGRQ